MTSPPDGRRSNWLKSNLAALGSAAVLSVYAVGYLRTKPAADRLADESARRKPPAPPPPVITVGHVDIAPESTTHPAEKPAKRIEVTPPPRKTDSVVSPASALAPAPAPAPQPQQQAQPVAQQPPASPPPASPTDSAPAEKQPVALRDGLYSGWGTSRHGDIQAYVEIKGGRIVSAFISECLTQYDCSWISKLPAQVVARQSADVDFVSGATHSTNAFYYAVVEALKKAK
jgi:uncharacterized protein with FMN-binding domain